MKKEQLSIELLARAGCNYVHSSDRKLFADASLQIQSDIELARSIRKLIERGIFMVHADDLELRDEVYAKLGISK